MKRTTSVHATGPATTQRVSPQTLAYGALGVGIISLGMSAIFIKWAGVPGGVAALYRVAIATVVLAGPFAWSVRRQAAPLPRRTVLLALLSGVWFAGDLGLWSEAVRHTSAANSTLLGNLAPLWVALGAMVLWKVRLRAIFWVGLGLAFVGGIIVVGPDLLAGTTLGYGDGLAVLASTFYATYMLNTQHSRRTLGILTFTWLSVLGSTIVLLLACLLLGLPLWGFSTQTWLALLGMGLLPQVAGYLAINYALGHLPAPIVSVTLLGQPVVTALLAVPLLAEGLSGEQIVGGLIVLGGIYLANRANSAPRVPTVTVAPEAIP